VIFAEPMAKSGGQATLKEKTLMQTLAFLSWELQVAQQSLRETFAGSQGPPKEESEHPIKDAYAVIETPETSGLIPVDTSAEMGTVQGATEAPTNSRRGATNGILNSEQLRQQPAPGGSNLGIR
jgi:hypothetical protein